jgi:hypothetical protein
MIKLEVGSKCPKHIGIIGMLKHHVKRPGEGCDVGSVCCHMCSRFRGRKSNNFVLCGPPSNENRTKKREEKYDNRISELACMP